MLHRGFSDSVGAPVRHTYLTIWQRTLENLSRETSSWFCVDFTQ